MNHIIEIPERDEIHHPDRNYEVIAWVFLVIAGLFIALGSGLIVGWVVFYINNGGFLK